MTDLVALTGAIALIMLGGLFAAVDAAIGAVSTARVAELVRDERPGAVRLAQVPAITAPVPAMAVSAADPPTRLATSNATRSSIWSTVGSGAELTTEAAIAASRSHGLGGMRERVELIGGDLEIVSTPGEGTRYTIEIPVWAVPTDDAIGDPSGSPAAADAAEKNAAE